MGVQESLDPAPGAVWGLCAATGRPLCRWSAHFGEATAVVSLRGGGAGGVLSCGEDGAVVLHEVSWGGAKAGAVLRAGDGARPLDVTEVAVAGEDASSRAARLLSQAASRAGARVWG